MDKIWNPTGMPVIPNNTRHYNSAGCPPVYLFTVTSAEALAHLSSDAIVRLWTTASKCMHLPVVRQAWVSLPDSRQAGAKADKKFKQP
ncbi:MAG: hypothetical protein ABIG11_04715 [bacterium]